ncbi:hypothetical protein GCM10017557_14440 [Streptomyces aurantiacus]|uniref:Uncharacterized protein n=1 Tax=Streptomyces aurantiacus TaxID=47760 RepID=A0A7G1P0K3_9ACTN|nr:hypothetical protein GCM10017557_14440 [Streptomyces aurantiacus]
MTDDLVQRAHWGDLDGQNWAGLVRLSLEAEDEELTARAARPTPDHPAGSGTKWRPATGRDIKSREEQEKDARRFVESRGGRYVLRSPKVISAVPGSFTRWQIRPPSWARSAVTPGPRSEPTRWPATTRCRPSAAPS